MCWKNTGLFNSVKIGMSDISLTYTFLYPTLRGSYYKKKSIEYDYTINIHYPTAMIIKAYMPDSYWLHFLTVDIVQQNNRDQFHVSL